MQVAKKYHAEFKCHGAWEDHLILDDRPPCLNKFHIHIHIHFYHYMQISC